MEQQKTLKSQSDLEIGEQSSRHLYFKLHYKAIVPKQYDTEVNINI